MEALDGFWKALVALGGMGFLTAIVRYVRAPVADWESLNVERKQEIAALKGEIEALRHEIGKLRDELKAEREEREAERERHRAEADGLRRQLAQHGISAARILLDPPRDDLN